MILTVILIVLMVYFLGKYAIQEGGRIEKQKKFMILHLQDFQVSKKEFITI